MRTSWKEIAQRISLLRNDGRRASSLELRQLTDKERVFWKLGGEFGKLSASYLWLLFAQGRHRQQNLRKRPQVAAVIGGDPKLLDSHFLVPADLKPTYLVYSKCFFGHCQWGGIEMNIAPKPLIRLPFFGLVAFFSGISCLVYELVWSRYLTLIFGASVYAVACVLACFMLGLALGSWLLGKLADLDDPPDNRRSTNLLIGLAIGIGIYGMISPWLFSGIREWTTLIFQNGYPGELLKNMIRISLAMMVLIIPTFLMGGTFPVMIKLFHRLRGLDIQSVGAEVATLYSINTFGGVVGAFLTGFCFIRFWGLQNTIYFAGLLNFISAGLVYLCFRDQTVPANKTKQNKIGPAPPILENRLYSKKMIYVALAAFTLSGFTSLGYEVFWTKILTFFFRDSIYDFSIVLTAFLTGIVIGSFLCGKLLAPRKNPLLLLGFTEILIGIGSLCSLFLIGRLPYMASFLQSMSQLYAKFGDGYWFIATVARFGYAFLVMLIPTILLGATFPLVSMIVAGDSKKLGRTIGMMNGMNTLGATVGSLLAGFVLTVWLGIQISIIFLTVINIGIGIILCSLAPFRNFKLKTLILSISILIPVLIIMVLPPWDKVRMSTNVLEPNQPVNQMLSILYYHEDAYGITSVTEFKPRQIKILTTNRLYSQNTSAMMGLEDHRRLGYIPVLLHKNPQSALVIGLGAGVSLRGVSESKLNSIDCVEISQGVMEAARYFSPENHHILANPKIHFIVDDGRNYLSISHQKYDVIIGDILFPMSSGSSNMFSREYFSLCKKHLQPEGLMCQWLPVHQLSLAELKTIIKTFKTVFPHTSLWYGMIGSSVPVIGCIGTQSKLAIDFESLQKKYQDPIFVKNLREANLDTPAIFLSNFIMEGAAIDSLTMDQIVNTDDHPIIEFSNPKLADQFQERSVVNLTVLNEATGDVTPFLVNIGKNKDIRQIGSRVSGCILEIGNIIKQL